MPASLTSPPHPAAAPRAATLVAYRSGAVAQMLQMPVATLRVWERRYGLSQHPPSPGGQRLYGAEDVRKLSLIKQLTDIGHPIGSLAALDLQQLQGVALTHASTVAARGDRHAAAAPRVNSAPWRLVTIGATLGARVQRPALLRRLGRPVVLLGPFESLEQAASALQGQTVDAVVLHAPHLLEGSRAAIDAAGPAFSQARVAVLYGFAADAVCERLASAGVALLREPQPDVVIAQWLHGLAAAASATARPGLADVPAEAAAVPPRRWDVATLTAFAGMSSTIACECPRHLAELLLQLQHFEDYSAACEHRNKPDALLHAYLHSIAATSRAAFEDALAQVALHEGLALPATAAPPDASAATPATPARQGLGKVKPLSSTGARRQP